jgi:hypothetical protein
MRYTDPTTGIREVVRPGVDFFAHDHEAVKRHPRMFRRATDPLSPQGRREHIDRLKSELVSIERKKRALAGGGSTRTSRPLPRRTSPWRLAEPGTRPRTGKI